MTEKETVAANFCATIKPKPEFDEQQFLMWGNQLRIDAVACTIDNPEDCEFCSS